MYIYREKSYGPAKNRLPPSIEGEFVFSFQGAKVIRRAGGAIKSVNRSQSSSSFRRVHTTEARVTNWAAVGVICAQRYIIKSWGKRKKTNLSVFLRNKVTGQNFFLSSRVMISVEKSPRLSNLSLEDRHTPHVCVGVVEEVARRHLISLLLILSLDDMEMKISGLLYNSRCCCCCFISLPDELFERRGGPQRVV